MSMELVFSKNFLSHIIDDFKLSDVANIRRITLEIKILIEELETGKFESLKEEEVKSRYINTFFGDILGFNCVNPDKWLLREEKKSTVDGTKPDAVLGYFFREKEKDKVKAVIELKDAGTDLDTEQKRPGKQTAVDQAFEYVAKMGGVCKWVIVSNIKEIRFYPSLDRSKFQVFYLRELKEESKLKELLFLFHKDRFIREEGISTTDKLYERACSLPTQEDKPLHIIDELYNNLKKFDGLRFVDPNYLAAIKPFNILDEHVWHYEKRNLFTINPAIFHLLKEINLEDTEVSFSDSLQKEIQEAGVIEAKHKIIHVFLILNQCFVQQISAVKDYQAITRRNKNTIGFSHRVHFGFKEGEEGVTRNIMVIKDEQCDCLICNYRNFDFNRLLTKLKVAEGNDEYNSPEYAFGNYLAATDNFKATYNKLKVIENDSKGKQGKGVAYFLAKHNLLLLHNLVSDYNLDDRKEILRYIRGIDLDKVVYEEIEFDVDKEVRSYLLKVKEDDLIYKLQDEINDTVDDIEKLKLRYENGGGQMAGPNLWHDLMDHYFPLYLYVNLNFVVYDNFKRYRTLAQKVFQGFVWSHQTPQWGVPSFNSFMLTEAILFVPRDKLQEILKDVNELKIDEKSLEEMLRKLCNLTSSYYEDGLFEDPLENIVIKIQLNNYRFKDNFTNIFSNLFTLLSRLDISKEKFQKCKQPLLKFLKIERELHWYDLREFCAFVRQKAHIFEATELEELLSIAINRNKYGFNKYSDMIQQIPKALLNAHPGYKIAKTKLISTALLNSSSETGDHENYMHLIDLVNVCNEECQQLLYNAFEKFLDNEFNADFYEKLLLKTTYDFNRKGYFKQYTEYVNLHKGCRTYKFGKSELTDLRFYNYINLIYQRRIEFKYRELKLFTGLNSFESWLLNPFHFDYSNFDAKWLHDLSKTVVIERLLGNKNIAAALDKELEACFDPVLAELKYKYFKVLNN